jgi:hypothetical protein
MSTEAYAPLKALGEQRMSDLTDLMVTGQSISSLVRVLHEEWCVCLDMKAAALHKMLQRYRKNVVEPTERERISQALVAKRLPEVRLTLNALHELEATIMVQQERIQKALNTENKMQGLLLKDTREEIRLLKDLLHELAMVQLETGVMKRATKTFQGTFLNPDGTLSAVQWTEKTEEALQFLEQDLLELAAPAD